MLRESGMRTRVGSAFLFAALLAAAAPAALAAEWNEGGGAAWDTLLAEAKQEGGLVLAACPDMASWIGPAFAAETGIDISFIAGDIADVAARYQMEAESGNLTIDVRLGGPIDVNLANAGKLTSLPEQLILPDATDPQKWMGGKLTYDDDEQRYLVIPSEYVSSRPLINTDIIDPASIKTLDDLLKPEFKGKIAGLDPGITGGGQSLAVYYASLRDIDFIKQLYTQQEIVRSRDSRQLLEWAARGTYPIILGLEVAVLQRFREAGIESLTMVPLDDAPGTTVGGCSVASIPVGAPHPKSAAVFLNWYLSHAGQQAYEEALLLPSLRTDLPHTGVLDYLLIKPGENYLPIYREDWFLHQQVPFRNALREFFQQ
jgi:iron(III) transport system substrate-binding protein